MKAKQVFFILVVILTHALVACGAATPTSEQPTVAPQPAPTATPEPVDLAAIAQSFYKASNEGDIDAAMALVAEDVKCRGACYLTGIQSFRFYIQGGMNSGAQTEISDLKVDGDKVTYKWKVYSQAGFFQASGVEVMHIQDGKIILIETDVDGM
jgi:hypothetical protein